MAISATHAKLFRSLPLPRGGSLLEIGEANWYGDEEPDWLEQKATGLSVALGLKPERDLFAVAKSFYRDAFAPSLIVSIDMNGTPAALRRDLNQEIDTGEFMWCCGALRASPVCPQCGETKELCPLAFDVVINHGTAEHVFNIAQVFKTMHDQCKPDGGLMIHEAPFTGWINHGFYCLQPTLFYDVAAANNYEIVLMALQEIKSQWTLRLNDRDHVHRLNGELPDNAMLFVCFRKLGEREFRIPMQGYYAAALSEAGNKAWSEMR